MDAEVETMENLGKATSGNFKNQFSQSTKNNSNLCSVPRSKHLKSLRYYPRHLRKKQYSRGKSKRMRTTMHCAVAYQKTSHK